MLPTSSALPPVAPIDHVYGTLGLLHATSTQEYSQMAGMREELEGKGSFTMFAPSDDAWAQLDPVSSPVTSNGGAAGLDSAGVFRPCALHC